MKNVQSGQDKQLAYSIEYKQFNKALKEKFYLEAIAISYAIIEDRLVAFLHHAGIVTRGQENLKINRAVYPYVRKLLKQDEKYSVKVKDLSIKITLISTLLKMSKEEAETIDLEIELYIQGLTRKRRIAQPGLMKDLYKQIQKVNSSEVLAIFERIEPWRNDRNQLIHALLSKTADTVAETKKSCAESSYVLTRELDNCLVKPFKKNNRIRKKYNIQ